MGQLARRLAAGFRALSVVALLLTALVAGVPATGASAAGAPAPPAAAPRAGAALPAACNGTPNLTISATPPNGTAPLNVFFNTSIVGGCAPYEVEWQFGDAGEGSGTSLYHVFRGAGTFDVLAVATDQLGHSGSNHTLVHVSGGSGPVTVAVTALPSSGAAPLSVTCWANVTGGNVTSPNQILWSFGDGGNGTGSPIGHLYASAGTYNVSASYFTTYRVASGGASVTVGPGGTGSRTNLSLSAEPTPSSPPALVTISAETNGVGAPFNLTLCFGDGSPCTFGPSNWSGTDDPTFTHSYVAAGNYSADATLANTSGIVATASVVVVVLPAAPLSDVVSVEPRSGTAPLTVAFLANVSGGIPPYSIQWWFGDGTVGASVSGTEVSHVYAAGGTYGPRVEINDSAGHSLALPLSAISVGTAATGFLPSSYGGVSTPYVLAILALAAVVAGYLVGRWALARTQGERLRKEGEQLVRQMEQRQ